jgi:hypothetical protein
MSMGRDIDDENLLGNGPAAAALLAAGAGCCAMGILYVAGSVSPALNRIFSIYRQAGALSGVSTGAIIVWLMLWLVLDRRWGKSDVALGRICIWSAALLGTGLLLTFPPIARLF